MLAVQLVSGAPAAHAQDSGAGEEAQEVRFQITPVIGSPFS